MPGDKKKYRDQDEMDAVQIKEEYANGPVAKRKCTDWWCCPVFVAFVVVMFVISIYGFSNGDPAALATPFDSEGNQCGLTAGYSDYPYIFFANPVNFGTNESDDSSSLSFNLVCVRSCPWYSDREGIWKDLFNAPENPSAEETGSSNDFSDTSSSSDGTELLASNSDSSAFSSSSSDWLSVFSDTLTSSDGESGYADYITELFSWLSLFNQAYEPYKWTDFFELSKLDCKPISKKTPDL